ncbi:hypothetical protein [Pseudomonas syringae]|uniref:hypothetical protein n=1 Tax=Pseudomonas syringae TaxID=317 RepID=UPI000517050C|nr:hypothetical protein [Pseudomonas syringae]ALU59469.1 hypothetical protein ACA40_06170 [Pseudomonas syringae pv. lapsa]
MTRRLGVFSQAPCRECAGSALQMGALRIHINIAPAEGQRAARFAHCFISRNKPLYCVLVQLTTIKPT